MHHIDNYDWTIATSVLALVISFVANPDQYLKLELSLVSLISASVLCITGIVKLIDLILEKSPTWIDKMTILKEKIKNLLKPKG